MYDVWSDEQGRMRFVHGPFHSLSSAQSFASRHGAHCVVRPRHEQRHLRWPMIVTARIPSFDNNGYRSHETVTVQAVVGELAIVQTSMGTIEIRIDHRQ